MKYLSQAPYTSEVSRAVKKAQVIGAVHRVRLHCTHDETAIHAAVMKLYEFTMVGYPTAMILKAVRHAAKKRTDIWWVKVAEGVEKNIPSMRLC